MNKPSAEALHEFWRDKTPFTVKGCVLVGGIICGFMGIMTLISLGVLGSLDAIFMICLAYGICFRRSRACAVTAAVYYAMNQLVLRFMLPEYTPSSDSTVLMYSILLGMVLSIYGTFTFRKMFEDEQQKNALPPPDSESR